MIVYNWSTFRNVFAIFPYEYDVSGIEIWPVDYVRINGFTEITLPVVPSAPDEMFPLIITANDGAFDAVPFVDEYDWYVSQRTDDLAKQYLSVQRHDFAEGTKSGSIQIGDTALADDELGGIDASPSAAQLQRLFNRVTIYCQRRSDKSIQLVQPTFTINSIITEPS